MLLLKAARQSCNQLFVRFGHSSFAVGKRSFSPWIIIPGTRLHQSGSLSRQLSCSEAFLKRGLVTLGNSPVQVPPVAVASKSVCTMADIMSQRMVWVDLEMTGLDVEKDAIIEMACIITDSEINILAEGPNVIIKQPDELLDGMSAWCKEHHGKSGLTQAVRESKVSLQHAEYEFLSFVRQHTPPRQCPLAGNSVHADKKFLDKYMPEFMRHLHYRIIDVSTIKELCRRWYPEEYEQAPKKALSHRALDDIQESIKELHFYRNNVFKKKMDEKKRKVIENSEHQK